MVGNDMQNLQTRLAQFKDQAKAKNVKNRMKLSINKNNRSLQTQTMFNPLDTFEICCII